MTKTKPSTRDADPLTSLFELAVNVCHVRQAGYRVRATDQVIDDGELFARPGEVGDVVDVDVDGMVTVAFPNAPQVTTCYLGRDCEAI